MSITVPIPTTFEEAVWLTIGVLFGRSFGKKLDWDIQQTDWFKKQNTFIQNILTRVMDFSHHWWAGALLMLYTPQIFLIFTFTMIYWFGAGLLLDDLPDVPERINKVLNSYKVVGDIENITTVETNITPSKTTIITPTIENPL